MLPTLSHEEILRYSRHLLIPEVGLEGQRKLKAASVLVIGTGGLGSPVALYLAAAGVGRIGLVDYDVVDFSNLQRQVIHGTSTRRQAQGRIGPRAHAGPQPGHPGGHLQRAVHLRQRHADRRADYDMIIDGTDNFPTRYLTNDVCVLTGQAQRVRLDLPLRRAGERVRCPARARATAACSPSRPRPGWCPPAPRAACWACCPARSARCRQPRRSS